MGGQVSLTCARFCPKCQVMPGAEELLEGAEEAAGDPSVRPASLAATYISLPSAVRSTTYCLSSLQHTGGTGSTDG